MIRRAVYAGSFYKSNPDTLVKSVEACFMDSLGPGKLPKGIAESEETSPFFLVPHAGHMYSGPVAASSFLEMCKYKKPDTIVILGPNHTGMGSDIAVPDKAEGWETPLGTMKINQEFVDKLIDICSLVKKNDSSHDGEHSIEVQLPFIQYLYDDPPALVPIAMLNQGYDSSMLLGETIGKIINDENIIVIASSDFTHFESHDSAKEKDARVLKAIENMDPKTMYKIKYQDGVSMCGIGPIAATIEAAKQTGREKCKLLNYATSGDVSGDRSQVVGYGSAVFYKNELII
ncbi:MAG: AmmeMemoRadiSam system protein B [Candidatus Heimdallarchaeota archaeon]|nr:AmmeMemoRadiSam system protein B [Candidatus Heimdallarchaeota archaeon]MCG3255586.1 AmmeMemoRadiSam system protein B [Candidatus Heimdallarchaeota archaeon]MCK4610661.1 AmmeMemoRadiSam system protein B [Candidatus Heimdallarchaeota archaeon]